MRVYDRKPVAEEKHKSSFSTLKTLGVALPIRAQLIVPPAHSQHPHQGKDGWKGTTKQPSKKADGAELANNGARAPSNAKCYAPSEEPGGREEKIMERQPMRNLCAFDKIRICVSYVLNFYDIPCHPEGACGVSGGDMMVIIPALSPIMDADAVRDAMCVRHKLEDFIDPGESAAAACARTWHRHSASSRVPKGAGKKAPAAKAT
ncbi:TonB-dependent receptor [Anopheles sinensis]|uniref:TonB-dependent receptor n=1 Tax=Anopheles sinensis TaxID=74873 RepID=A0A084VRF9_ANOSI|nr:TonB-dependent receptor [Anopheles sinensis]